jgi:hypothetical protein
LRGVVVLRGSRLAQTPGPAGRTRPVAATACPSHTSVCPRKLSAGLTPHSLPLPLVARAPLAPPLAAAPLSPQRSQVLTGKCYHHGWDKAGRPISFIRVDKHDAYTDREALHAFVVFCIDESVARSETVAPGHAAPARSFTTILDCNNFGRSNFDTEALTYILKMLGSNYPERLGALYIIRCVATWRETCGGVRNVSVSVSLMSEIAGLSLPGSPHHHPSRRHLTLGPSIPPSPSLSPFALPCRALTAAKAGCSRSCGRSWRRLSTRARAAKSTSWGGTSCRG